MSKVAIIGFGNLGYHLAVSISKKHEVTVFGRVPEDDLIKSLGELDPSEFDFVIITVTDSAIKGVSESLAASDAIVLHTSGFRPLSDLQKHERKGVMYPLQTISKEKKVNFNSFPIFVEGTDLSDKEIFRFLRSFGGDIRFMNSQNRAKLHLAAVFASNFTNHLYHICDELLAPMELSFKEIKHLSQETLDKAVEIGPLNSQTGPAVRGDQSTISAHLSMLQNENWKDIYQLISDSIRKSQQ